MLQFSSLISDSLDSVSCISAPPAKWKPKNNVFKHFMKLNMQNLSIPLHAIQRIQARTYLQLPLRDWGASNTYLLVLSSWKVNIAKNPIAFQLEPSYEGSEPSTLIFKLKTSWIFFLINSFLSSNVFFLTHKISHFKKKQYYLQ